ncbi:MAG: LytR C-terminal domain-containing protein [Actinomycetota bacterium]
MGKHSNEDQSFFWRSILLVAVKWIAVLSLPVLAGWGLWRLIQPGRSPNLGGAAAATLSPASPTPTARSPAPATEPAPPPPSPPPTAAASSTVTSGPTGPVQVLVGTTKTDAGQVAADRLRAAGFKVVAVQRAARGYDLSTAFYQPGYELQAARIAQVVGATVTSPAPAGLSQAVAVTVVVGADFKS